MFGVCVVCCLCGCVLVCVCCMCCGRFGVQWLYDMCMFQLCFIVFACSVDVFVSVMR